MQNFLPILKPGKTWPQLVFAIRWSPLPGGYSPLEDYRRPEDLRAQDTNPFYSYPSDRMLKVMDLQAIAVGFGGSNLDVMHHVDGDEPIAFDGSVIHAGDETSGGTSGWDETINLNLEMLPETVRAVALYAHCRSGHSLAQSTGSTFALMNLRDGAALCQGPLNSVGQGEKAMLCAMVVRYEGNFFVRQVGQLIDAGNLQQAAMAARPFAV